MPLQIVQVDAFTSRPFTGNPAAVCLLDDLPPDSRLQDIAREMNLAETAFLLAHEEGFDLRWFTPTVEVDLCGHATLASAHVLWEDEHVPADEAIRFHTRSGVLTATRAGKLIELDFPSEPATPAEPPDDLIRALGIDALRAGRSRFDWLVEVDNEKALRTLKPDMSRLERIDTRGVIVTSLATTARVDFVSRFFAPASGIPEDPVTGSAHCTLAPYWAARLQKPEMVGFQVSARSGMVHVRLQGDRVVLGGEAVTVMRGTLLA